MAMITVQVWDATGNKRQEVELPDDAPVEETARVTSALASSALGDPVVVGAQSYAGTASPYTFNGLVRHYFLREQPSHGDLQIQLLPKEARAEDSHDVAKRLRERLVPVATSLGAAIQVVEVPPGPPVLQTLVAEVYGPDPDERLRLARAVRSTFEATPGVVDVDWYVESERSKWRLDVDSEKAAVAGLTAADVAAVVRMAGAGAAVGLLHDPVAREDVPIVLRLPRDARGSSASRANRGRARPDRQQQPVSQALGGSHRPFQCARTPDEPGRPFEAA